METTKIKLHDNPVLWEEHKSLEEVLSLKATTPQYIFETTYQGHPTSPRGNIFHREWWDGKNRYHQNEEKMIGRWISMDTGLSEEETAAYSSIVIGDLMADYRLRIILSWAERVGFPQLVSKTKSVVYAYPENLKGVVIENKVSGISLIQTLRQADQKVAGLVRPYTPKQAKVMRWNEAAVWCSLGCVLLPHPSPDAPWLFDLEEDLFSAPDTPFRDRLDAFSQLVLFLGHLLSEGYNSRKGK